MSQSKPFATYDEQISTLASKHLIVTNIEEAKRLLSEIGYFTLIVGYKHPFLNKNNRKYKDGVTFEDIVMLYRFDEALRHLFLRYLLTIERRIKARIAYEFCAVHGNSQQEYLNAANYANDPRKAKNIQHMIDTLSNLATKPSDYPYIKHHRAKHNNVPLWVLINAVTFGSTSKMFGLLPQNLQSRIARDYPLNIRQLAQILSVLTKYRNACAHSERLFSYTTRDDIPDLPLHFKLGIEKKGNQYKCGKHDLFSVVIAFRYLLHSDTFATFKRELSKEIEAFAKNCGSLSEAELLQEMGFPSNWKRITRQYKLDRA